MKEKNYLYTLDMFWDRENPIREITIVKDGFTERSLNGVFQCRFKYYDCELNRNKFTLYEKNILPNLSDINKDYNYFKTKEDCIIYWLNKYLSDSTYVLADYKLLVAQLNTFNSFFFDATDEVDTCSQM